MSRLAIVVGLVVLFTIVELAIGVVGSLVMGAILVLLVSRSRR